MNKPLPIIGLVLKCEEDFKWYVRPTSSYVPGGEWKDDYIGPLISHESEEINFLKSLSKTFPIFIDIGAHVGSFSIRLNRYFELIHAFEPNPKVFEALSINAVLNNSMVVLHPYGLADKDGKEEIFLRGACSQITSLGEPRLKQQTMNLAHELREIVMINVSTLDNEFFNEIAPKLATTNFVVKVDTEGFELKVLNGAKKMLQYNSFWMIEHHEEVYDLPNRINDIKQVMKEAGHNFLGDMGSGKLLFSNCLDVVKE